MPPSRPVLPLVSQELCNFVLDALTEDLNRVAVQPYVPNYESDGTEPDAQVGQLPSPPPPTGTMGAHPRYHLCPTPR